MLMSLLLCHDVVMCCEYGTAVCVYRCKPVLMSLLLCHDVVLRCEYGTAVCVLVKAGADVTAVVSRCCAAL